jgi:hypothetical protein
VITVAIDEQDCGEALDEARGWMRFEVGSLKPRYL